MKKIKFKLWTDHWNNGVFYSKGSDIELTKEQYEWLCDATGKAREESPDFWEEKISKEIDLNKKRGKK